MSLLQACEELEKAMSHPDIADEAYSKCLDVHDRISFTLVNDVDPIGAMHESLGVLRTLLPLHHPARAH